jgi:hypothetical protein
LLSLIVNGNAQLANANEQKIPVSITNFQQGEYLVDSPDIRHFSPTPEISQSTSYYGWCADCPEGKRIAVHEQVIEFYDNRVVRREYDHKLDPDGDFIYVAHPVNKRRKPNAVSITIWIRSQFLKSFVFASKTN